MQTLPILLSSSSSSSSSPPTADTPPPQLTTSINQLRSFSTALSAFINHYDDLHTHINFINSSIDSILPRHLLHTANPSLLKQVRLLESFSDRRINDLPDVIVLEQNPRESVSDTRSYEYETTPDSTYLLHNGGGIDVLDNNNKLEDVDVSENYVKTDHVNNKLEVVDVPKIYEGIDVFENRVEIDVSNNNKLEVVDVLKISEGIDVCENRVEIDVSNNNKLEVVDVSKIYEGIDVCENRVEPDVSNNNKLKVVDVLKISEGIDVCENRVEIDVSNNNKLGVVDVSKNAEGIDVSENSVEIDTSNNKLEAVDVSNNCEEIDVFENNMEIDVSNNKLEVVDVPNICEEIDMCKNPVETDTLNNKLEVVDVSKNFEEIDMFKKSIEIGNLNNKLEVVYVSMNCEEIDVFKNPVELDVSNNFDVVGVLKNSEGIDVSENPVETDTSNNKLEVVDVSMNCEEIYVSKNPVETNTSNNQLEVLDVSENHVEIDTLKTFDSTDLLHNYGGIDASNKLEVVNVSKSFEEIDVLMKKSDEIVTETFGDQTTGVVPEAIVSEQNLNGMATNGEQSHGQVRTPESLEEIDVSNKIEQNNILRKPEQTDTLSKHKRPGTRKKDTETETLNKFARKMQFLCENMNSKGMRWHVMQHLSETFDLREEIAKALKLAKDPAKLVLNCTGMFFEQDSSAFCKESGSGQNKENRRLASVLILECFVMISGDDGIEIAKKDHELAAKYAVIWRKRMIREGGVGHTDDVDARGLLLLISGFGIQDDVFKIQDIVDLIRASNVKGISTALRHSVFLIPKIPEVINLMVKNNLETEAVDMAYTFGLKKLEVVDVSKNCEGIDVSKNPVEIDTSNDKLEVVGVSKSCEEIDVSENPVEVDALKKPVETVPETYCDHITPAVQETIVSKQDPDRMATNCEQSHENAPKKPAVIDISKMPEQTDILNKLEKIDILKKPEQTDACKNPEEPVVLKKWRKRKKTCKKPEETVPETSCDQTTPAVPEAIVSEQNPNRMATNPEQSHENVLKKPVVIDISKKPEQTDILKKHEEIDVLKTPEQTDVCKNPEQPVVTKKRKKREKTGILKKAEANETSEKSVVSVLRSFCKNMSHKKLRRHVATHFAEMINLREEIAKALKLAKDPAKLVLSSIGRFFVQSSGTYWKLHHEENLGRMAAVLILECFVMISSGGIEIAKSDQENAAQVAVDWKKRMIREGGPKPTDEVDARGLLLLISGFGIQDHVFKILDIMDLIRASNVKGISTALCRSAFLIQKVPWVVCLMVKSNLEVEAVDIAYTFGLEDVCHPQDILMEYLDNKIKDFQNSSPFQMLEAVEQHLFDLKSVKQCLESHNIDPSTLLPNLKINEKIHNLEKEVNKWKLIQKRKSLQNLIQQEAKRACFGHESMPRQHRPVDYDGMNEANRSTHTSTSHFNSDQNPETDTSKKPEVVEISKNPVEIYTFEEIDSSKKHAETDNSKMPEENVPETYYDETITTVSKAIVSEQNPSRMAGSHEQNHENARTPETLDEIDVSKKPEQTDILNEHELTNTCKNTEVTVVFKKPEELDTPMIPEEIDTMKKHEKTGTCKNAKETEALKKSKETEASKKPKETKGSKKPKETKALKKSKETEASKKPKETEASKKPKETEALKKPKETEASKKPKETEALKKPKETDASKKPKETEASKKPKETKASKKPKETEASKKPKETEASKKPKETEALKKPKETDASKKPKETKASKKPKETEASKKLMETEASKKPKEIKASKKPKSKETEASKKSTETEASKKSKETEASKKSKETEASKKSKETEASKKSKETEASKKSLISALESLCQSMSSKEMKRHVAAHFSEMINLRKQIAKTLKLAEDPAKLVLDSIGEFFVQDRKTFCQDTQKLGRKAAVLILECFVMISSDDIEVTKPDQEYAAQAAVDWKKRMVREGGLRHMDEVDARGLLLLISGFGIQDHVFKIRDILDLIRASNVKGISTALRRSVFLVPKIPEVIDFMVKNNLEIEAADVAYTFGLEDKRQPLIILATFLRNHIRNIQSCSFSQKLEEMKQQLFDLKAVKRCLESHNIDPSLHLPEFKINEKIQNLQNELNEAKFIKKRKSLEGPIHQEAKRACFGHESMPRNQSPVDHYGLNRRYQSTHLSTGYFDSDQDLLNRYISNYSPSSVYNTPAMRETVISPVPNGPASGFTGSYDHMHHSANVQPYGSNRPWGRGPPELFPEFHQSGGFPGRRGPSSDLYGFADIVEKKCMR